VGHLIIKPENKVAPLEKDKTLLAYLQELGVNINAYCGGRGECRACLVKIEAGAEGLNPVTELEKEFIKTPDQRLACQAKTIREDLEIYVKVPKYAKYKILERGKRLKIKINPLVKVIETPLTKKVYWLDRELGSYEGEVYGLALDIGTTTVSMYWVNLETGEETSVASTQNPQVRFGDNVIDRVSYARLKSQEYLEKTIREAVNELINGGQVNPNHIYEMTVVGNTVMRDIFIGHPVKSLGEAPFKPVTEASVNKTAEELEIKINPKANIYALPLIGHFVGADALAVILATEMYKKQEVTMAVDIGTNTEIIIGNKDKLIATSAASGPAFEGSGIKCGTGAVSGAIQKVEIDENLKVKYETIDDMPPIGICGSGLIDILAQMLERGILDWTGKLTTGEGSFTVADGENPVTIDGEDIDKLKLAKAAIAVGIKVVMRHYGVSTREVEKLYLAGAFGTYINPVNALKIGLLPDLPLEKIERVGNAAVEGARQALISQEKRMDAETIARKVEHVRLELEKGFQDLFVEELCFTKYRR
jgi:uncharacterized 2Fe-2S/4Fe-4S cluster protein (DUF4445 family)